MSKELSIKHSVFIKTSSESVYKTLTTAKGWNSWFTDETEIDLEAKTIKLVWKDFGPGHENVTDQGDIVKEVPNSEFSFTWHPINQGTTVSFFIRPHANGTMLTVEDKGFSIETLEMFRECSIGWGEALTLLKFYLEYGVVYGKVPKVN